MRSEECTKTYELVTVNAQLRMPVICACGCGKPYSRAERGVCPHYRRVQNSCVMRLGFLGALVPEKQAQFNEGLRTFYLENPAAPNLLPNEKDLSEFLVGHPNDEESFVHQNITAICGPTSTWTGRVRGFLRVRSITRLLRQIREVPN